MNKTNLAVAAAVSALALGASAAQAQSPFAFGQSTGQDPLSSLLGALFGNTTGNATATLDTQWSQGGRPLYDGRTQFQTRVQTALSSGALTQQRADRLRQRYDALVDVEAGYVADRYVTAEERADLNARYQRLTDRLDESVADGPATSSPATPAPSTLDNRTRLARIEADLTRGERNGNLNAGAVARLRATQEDLRRLDDAYGENGLNNDERRYLDRRLTELEAWVVERGG